MTFSAVFFSRLMLCMKFHAAESANYSVFLHLGNGRYSKGEGKGEWVLLRENLPHVPGHVVAQTVGPVPEGAGDFLR
jgi:hypothetical protein